MVNDLTLLSFRLVFLVILWLFILSIVVVLKNDLAIDENKKHFKKTFNQTNEKPHKIKNDSKKNPVQANCLKVFSTNTGTKILDVSNHSSIVIGRGEDCFLTLEDSYASTRHARLFKKNGIWNLEDLGSTNGTFLDDMQVTTAVQPKIGQPFKIGQTTFELGQ